MKHLVVALLLAASCKPKTTTTASITTQAGDLVIADVTVVPMDREGVLAHHAVVVRGAQIAAVAPVAAVAIADGVTKIDGRGKWLLPGLADMHVHTFDPNDLTLFVVAGVTTVRNMFGNELHVDWRDRIAKGERFGPTIVTAGPIVDGKPPIWPGSRVLTEVADAEKVVAEHVAAHYDFIKPYNGLSKEAYDALVAAANKQGVPVAGHTPQAVGLEHVIASKQRSIEHLDGWITALSPPGSVGLDFKPSKEALAKVELAKVAALAAQARAANTWNCPTLSVMARMGAMDDVEKLRKDVRWIETVPAGTLASWDPKSDFRMQSMTAESFATMRAANEVRAKILAELAKANAPLIAGTDMGNPFVVAGAGLHDELELMVKAGLTRRQALHAATAAPAEFLGKRGAFGVIAPGARADLVLVGVDPFAQPLPLPPDGVVLRGKWLPGTELRDKLAAIIKGNTAPASRWEGVPALVAEGTVVHQGHYDWKQKDGSLVGEERLAVGTVDGKRIIVAQQALDVPVPSKQNYRVTATSSSIAVDTRMGKLDLEGRVEGDKVVGTGKGFDGKPIAISEALEPGSFMSASGIGGTIALVDKLGDLAVGASKTVTGYEPTYFPKPMLVAAIYEVKRKPDASGNRVYAVTTKAGGFTLEGDLVVDKDGWPVSQHYGAPFHITIFRR